MVQPRKTSHSTRKTSGKSGEGELALLRSIRERAGAHGRGGVRLGIGDDCALLRLRAGEEMAVTTDLSIDGRHFRLDWHPAESVGHRTLARGLSDLAAMGARPVAAFLSLGLPVELTVKRQGSAWVERFYDGLLALAHAYQMPLAGGDLAESSIAVADVVLTGAVPREAAMLRSGARAGDTLYVTGRLGGAAAELAVLAADPARFAGLTTANFTSPHLYPQPRIAQGMWLRKRGLASAALDLSDGLSTDLAHLCEESGVAAEVDGSALPIAAGATLKMAIHGGEDYELLFAAPAGAKIPRKIAGVPITAIGRVVPRRRGQPMVTLMGSDGPQELKPEGWQHFS